MLIPWKKINWDSLNDTCNTIMSALIDVSVFFFIFMEMVIAVNVRGNSNGIFLNSYKSIKNILLVLEIFQYRIPTLNFFQKYIFLFFLQDEDKFQLGTTKIFFRAGAVSVA